MKILALETSTRRYSAAVFSDGKIAASQEFILDKLIETSLIPAVDKVLKQAKIPLARLDGFAVGIGPGSFTSLRVGLSAVKGFVFATEKPVVGISSLDALAARAKSFNGGDICVVCDAKRNLFYACLYEVHQGMLRRKTDYLLCPAQDVLKKIKKKTFFTGDGIQLMKDEIERHARARALTVSFAKEKDWYPNARELALLAEKRFKEKKFDKVETIIPLYLYPDDCQVTTR